MAHQGDQKKEWIVCFKECFNDRKCKYKFHQSIKVKSRYDSICYGMCCVATLEDLEKNLDYKNVVKFYAPDDVVSTAVTKEKRVLTPEALGALKAQPLGGFIQRIGADKSSQLSGNGTGSLESRTDINVFVVDTGIYPHPDLNVVGGRNFTSANANAWKDDNGHGTHVAGIIGSRDNAYGIVGVAPGVRLWAIKVLGSNGNGNISYIISAFNWILQTRGTVWKGHGVVNLSFGGRMNQALDEAVMTLVRKGLVVSVAAGNSSVNASTFSPARVPDVITVGATSPNPSYNAMASYSNFGSGVDILSPGSNIYSTYLSGYASLSGTSMAAPVVTGTIALILNRHPVPISLTSSIIKYIRDILVTDSSNTKPKYYDQSIGTNARIQIPSNKPTTSISVWAGGY